ncbi:MAG TPA: methylmalonyl-CoA mutase, partial [Roseiarcus sp.]|nr:methylmalonyl-CoA mutase [Roseiarcus sp.]
MSVSIRPFAAVSEEQWRRLVAKAIKDAPFETLIARSEDDIPIGPLYPRAVGPRAGRAKGRWRILARLDHPDPSAGNKQALEDLADGADGLEIVLAGASGAYGYGLAGGDTSTLELALRDVVFEAARIELDLGPSGEKA